MTYFDAWLIDPLNNAMSLIKLSQRSEQASMQKHIRTNALTIAHSFEAHTIFVDDKALDKPIRALWRLDRRLDVTCVGRAIIVSDGPLGISASPTLDPHKFVMRLAAFVPVLVPDQDHDPHQAAAELGPMIHTRRHGKLNLTIHKLPFVFHPGKVAGGDEGEG